MFPLHCAHLMVNWAAFTYFAVDEELEGAEGSCEDFWERGREGAGGEKLDIGLEQTHFIYGRGGPWKWEGLYGEQKLVDGRRTEEGTCGGGSCDAASSMRRKRMTNVAYKKPVTLSSTGAGAPENAVDGIVNVFYSVPFEQSHATTSGKVSMCELLLNERLHNLLLLVLLAGTVLPQTAVFPPDFLLVIPLIGLVPGWGG